MLKRWLLYLLTVIGCVIFYFAYLEWMAWLLLVAVLCLPIAGFLLSLPAMLTAKVSLSCGLPVKLGENEPITLQTVCPLPAPPVRGRIRIRRVTTGQVWKLKPGKDLPADHCGQLLCLPERIKIYDYLGLFYIRQRKKEPLSAVILPKPQPIEHLPDLERQLAQSWRPKPGGGFAENHELRLYRPGDSLNQIHWKMSAKTGKYIIREAMIPVSSRIVLTLAIRGTPEELDRKFGQLLWLGQRLLEKELRHEWCVLTGDGMKRLPITGEAELMDALHTVLSQPPAEEDAPWPHFSASWQYRIGGGQDEA